MDHAALHERARTKGANPVVYWIVRLLFQPFFLTYFRMKRIGREHIPRHGPVIIASNHRSFLDPFVIATMAKRPMYYVAKKELFKRPWQAWLLNALGAFPVDRGAADADTIRTAKSLLARGEIVLIFPEGTRIRPGALGRPRRGVGRLALETGVPVVPLAVIGTEAVRRGWRIRPHKVRIRAGAPLRFAHEPDASPEHATAVTNRIWPCVMLQWEWLGGTPPIRRAAIIGAGSLGTSLAVLFARAGFEVDLGCRTAEQAEECAKSRLNQRYLRGVKLLDSISVARASELELGAHDVVCLAVPARALTDVLAALGARIPPRAALLVLSKGLVPPLGTLPSAYAAERTHTRAVGVLGGSAHAPDLLEEGASVVVGSLDSNFAKQLADALTAAGLQVTISTDVTGVELAGCARNVASLAASTAASAGPNAAGAAAVKVFGEVEALARLRGGRPETFVGLAGAGDPAATVAGADSSSRDAEAVDSVTLLARAAQAEGLTTPALEALAALVEGRIAPEQWIETVTAPTAGEPSPSVRVA
jgi:glycerol-3-phosphate dehydrogenase (NAD(P)+)